MAETISLQDLKTAFGTYIGTNQKDIPATFDPTHRVRKVHDNGGFTGSCLPGFQGCDR